MLYLLFICPEQQHLFGTGALKIRAIWIWGFTALLRHFDGLLKAFYIAVHIQTHAVFSFLRRNREI